MFSFSYRGSGDGNQRRLLHQVDHLPSLDSRSASPKIDTKLTDFLFPTLATHNELASVMPLEETLERLAPPRRVLGAAARPLDQWGAQPGGRGGDHGQLRDRCRGSHCPAPDLRESSEGRAGYVGASELLALWRHDLIANDRSAHTVRRHTSAVRQFLKWYEAGRSSRVKRRRQPPSVKRAKRPACATLRLTSTLACVRWCSRAPGACSTSQPASMRVLTR